MGGGFRCAKQSLGAERFRREIELAGLQHPHLLPRFDSGPVEPAQITRVRCGRSRDLTRPRATCRGIHSHRHGT
jgi:hypothetical protein